MTQINKASLTSRKLARLIAEYASDKKAMDIAILDMRKVVSFCDYFVLCSGNTNRQVSAIANAIRDGMEEHGLNPPRLQSDQNSQWILIDLSDVIVHIFEKDMREFYGLEHLWHEAKEINLK